MANQRVEGANPLIVECIDDWNHWARKKYRYLNKGCRYNVIRTVRSTHGTPLYVLKTARGETHYYQHLFKIVDDTINYDPLQQGDRDEDI